MDAADLVSLGRQTQAFLSTHAQNVGIPFFPPEHIDPRTETLLASLLNSEDHLFIQAPNIGALLGKGVSLSLIMHATLGPRQSAPQEMTFKSFAVAASSPLLATHMTHAAGFGHAARFKKSSRLAACFFSLSASDSPEFHTAINFAAVFKSQTVFLTTALPEQHQTLIECRTAYGIRTVILPPPSEHKALKDVLLHELALARTSGPVLLLATHEPSTLQEENGVWSSTIENAWNDALHVHTA